MGTGLEDPRYSFNTLSSSLAGKVLIHIGTHDVSATTDLIDPHHSGLVLAHQAKNLPFAEARAILDLRRRFPSTPVLTDAAAYTKTTATPSVPFELTRDLFGEGLATDLDRQREAGAQVAITPTRYIPAGATETLRAVLSHTDALQRRTPCACYHYTSPG